VGRDVLVAEGWIPERAYEEVGAVFRQRGYRQLVVVVSVYGGDDVYSYGGTGTPYPDYVRALAVRVGVPLESAHVVLCRVTRRDRTYHCARSARIWLERNYPTTTLDVATIGAHARRSRLLYEQAFGARVSVGVIALRDVTYDAAHWWRSSEGVRETLGETIAYLYARLLFRPPDPPGDDTPVELVALTVHDLKGTQQRP
jgi:hypothetical protein